MLRVPPDNDIRDIYITFTWQGTHENARQNWKKLFAVRKFLSLATIQSKAAPAELLVANRYVVGKTSYYLRNQFVVYVILYQEKRSQMALLANFG